ncbi:MAG TPA: Lrp/AsnC family transcriptional regulator [Candidatus Accumulibacter sp.]|nr:Lrp/AsnC family transcriptional regulator [Accumulibacter sp.]
MNHNYEREPRYNLWFVVTAGSEGRLHATLGAIEQLADCPLLRLPMLREYHIDLGFALGGKAAPSSRRAPVRQPLLPPKSLDEQERRLVVALQEGLPLFIRPFSVLASRIGCDEGEVLERIHRWCAEGIIKRFGVIVRHHELGYTANAMLVHDIPDGAVDEVGEQLARVDGVNLCYRRPRILPDWPYNLFCMIHGQARSEVAAAIAGLRERLGLADYAHEILFSLTRFKQSGARYA